MDIPYTPDVASQFARFADPHNSILLETADVESRSLAVLKAALRVRCDRDEVTLTAFTETGRDIKAHVSRETSIDVLREIRDMGHLLVGAFAYDFEAEPLPAAHDTFPDYEFFVPEILLRVDHAKKTATITTHSTLPNPRPQPVAAPDVPRTATASKTDAEFRRDVEKLQEHIAAKEIDQVVPSRYFSVECPDALAAYRRLKESNPSPYLFYLRGEDYDLIGSSPESNLRFNADNREIRISPIAGTRPRGATPDEDYRNERDLRTNAKELAEHVMLIDLAREDLGAIADDLRVPRVLNVDRYSRVMHLVSAVTGTLRPGLDAFDAYRACMTMGTLTGAPKPRAAQLIRDVEKRRRGSFGGAVGYFEPDGTMDTAIIIRSAFIKDGVAHVAAGAGVVADSTPQGEADETFHKASAVLHAIAPELEVVR